eukprot:CFRG2006T1
MNRESSSSSRKTETEALSRVPVDHGDIHYTDTFHRDVYPRVFEARFEGKCRHMSGVTCRRTVSAGTLPALLERLTLNDPDYVRSFLTTYRSLMDPCTLFDCLVERYNEPRIESQAVWWVSTLMGTSWSHKPASDMWTDGTILCGVLNKLHPGLISSFWNPPKDAAEKIENMEIFLSGARALGLQGRQLFDPKDFVQDGNLSVVFETVHAVASMTWNSGVAPIHIVDRNSCRDVLFVLDMWLTSFWCDFMDAKGSATGEMIANFIRRKLECLDDHGEDSQLAQPLTMILKAHSAIIAHQSQAARLSTLTIPLVTRRSSNTTHTMDAYSAKVFASQLCVTDARLQSKLMVHEFLGCGWQKKDKTYRAPTLMKTIAFFNHVVEFVMTSIVQASSLPERLSTVERMIEILNELLLLQNLSSAKAVLAGLQSTPVFRLKRTWSAVSKEMMKIYEDAAQLLSEENNMARMRAALKVWSQPKVPYVGMYLSDLAYIDAAYDDTVGDEGQLINWDKKMKEYKALKPIVECQQRGSMIAVSLKSIKDFHEKFALLALLTVDECYALSLKVEPKDGKKFDTIDTSSILENRVRTMRELEAFLKKRPTDMDAMLEMIKSGSRILSNEIHETVIPIYTSYGVCQPVSYTCTPTTTAAEIVKWFYVKRSIPIEDMRIMLLNPYIDVVIPPRSGVLDFRDEFMLHCLRRQRNHKVSYDVMNSAHSTVTNGTLSAPDRARGHRRTLSRAGRLEKQSIDHMTTVCLMKPKGVVKVSGHRDMAGVIYKSIVIRCQDSSCDVIRNYLKKMNRDVEETHNFKLWHVALATDNTDREEKELSDAETCLKYTVISPYFFLSRVPVPLNNTNVTVTPKKISAT